MKKFTWRLIWHQVKMFMFYIVQTTNATSSVLKKIKEEEEEEDNITPYSK
jgi:hypothetical protein